MNKLTITLEPQHFKRNYLLYVIELVSNNTSQYYIGHTSDQQSVNNKYALIRLAEHFYDINSATGNHIYRYIANKIIEKGKKEDFKITEKIKSKVDLFLSQSKVIMHIYPLLEFDSVSKDEHKENLKNVRKFKHLILRIFKESKKEMMNNDKTIEFVKYNETQFPKIWEKIKTDFYI